MILDNEFFDYLKSIFQWWNSESIEFDSEKQSQIIQRIKDQQLLLFGADGKSGLQAECTRYKENAPFLTPYYIKLKERVQKELFLLEKWEDLYVASIAKKVNQDRLDLLESGKIKRFLPDLIGNLIREDLHKSDNDFVSVGQKKYRVGGTRALAAAGTPSVQKTLYKEMINPDTLKTGYNSFDYYINYSGWIKTDKDKETLELLKEVKASSISNCFGNLGRGNVFEMLIINNLAKLTPGKIAISPQNYIYDKNEKLVARFDALKLNDRGEIEEIIEIKSTNKPDAFLDSDEIVGGLGLALAVPQNYAHQLLFYMKMAAQNKGRIVALVNVFDLEMDGDALNLKEYPISVNDTVQNFVPKINSQPAKLLDIYNECFKKVLEFTQFFEENFKKGYKAIPPTPRKDNEKRRSEMQQFLKEIFWDDEIERFVAIDVETTEDRILEFGALVYDRYDKESGLIKEYGNLNQVNKNVAGIETLFSVPEDIIEINFGELPFQELHHITPEMVRGKKRFDVLDASSVIFQLLLAPNQVLMFHNKAMENGKFSLWVPDYIAALEGGKIRVIDTLDISKYLDSETKKTCDEFLKNDTLDSYSKRWGIKPNSETGDELHRGHDDARIMIETFFAHIKTLFKD
ncbi:MAG: hypothetical protein LBB07_01460 [Bifidobacteriaceae bacterium]|jgi:DNA polymerase III epsilon subunit-like protein|nr:hypothetical protein [Bifidobacteriaceae bacterium]